VVGYKHFFSRLYDDVAVGSHDLRKAVTFLPDGHLRVHLSLVPDVVDLGVQKVSTSAMLLLGRIPQEAVQTFDGRYQVQIESAESQGMTEFWLIYTDQVSGKFKRVKLSSEGHAPGSNRPRVSQTPSGKLFLADDCGIVRLYDTSQLAEVGVFQMAHPDSENQVIALAISADEQYIAGLSSWKNLVLYNVVERRVIFVRQIRDKVGWYDLSSALILLTADAEVIVTVGIGYMAARQDQAVYAVNAFRSMPTPAV
jgi:hypothetical protein